MLFYTLALEVEANKISFRRMVSDVLAKYRSTWYNSILKGGNVKTYHTHRKYWKLRYLSGSEKILHYYFVVLYLCIEDSIFNLLRLLRRNAVHAQNLLFNISTRCFTRKLLTLLSQPNVLPEILR